MNDDVPPPLPGSRGRAALVALVVLQLLQLASLVPWLIMAGLSVMAFDAPGSTEKWEPWLFVLGIWSYPLWLLVAGVVSWIAFAKGWRKTAVAIAAVFTAPAAFVAFAIVFGSRWLG